MKNCYIRLLFILFTVLLLFSCNKKEDKSKSEINNIYETVIFDPEGRKFASYLYRDANEKEPIAMQYFYSDRDDVLSVQKKIIKTAKKNNIIIIRPDYRRIDNTYLCIDENGKVIKSFFGKPFIINKKIPVIFNSETKYNYDPNVGLLSNAVTNIPKINPDLFQIENSNCAFVWKL